MRSFSSGDSVSRLFFKKVFSRGVFFYPLFIRKQRRRQQNSQKTCFSFHFIQYMGRIAVRSYFSIYANHTSMHYFYLCNRDIVHKKYVSSLYLLTSFFNDENNRGHMCRRWFEKQFLGKNTMICGQINNQKNRERANSVHQY